MTLSAEETYIRLTEIFEDAFGRTIVLTPELTAKDVEGWDSVKMVYLILAVEERFGIRVPSRDVDNLRNVGDFARLVQARLS